MFGGCPRTSYFPDLLHQLFRNPDLKWEKNKTWNIGLDFSFIDRISVTFDYYQRKTSDLIYDLPVSQVGRYYDGDYGYTTPQNIGSLKNYGFELTITS